VRFAWPTLTRWNCRLESDTRERARPSVNKAVVAARRIAEIDPYLRVVVEPTGIRPENLGEFLDGLDLVIEECDSLDMKFLVREAARDRQIPVIMETSDRACST